MCCEATRAGEAFSRARREIRPVYSLGAAATGDINEKAFQQQGSGLRFRRALAAELLAAE